MGAEGREPSGEDRSWELGDRRSGRAGAEGESEIGDGRWKRKGASPPVNIGAGSSELGDRDALTRRGKFYTTAKRLHNKAQGRFSAPWVHVRITHFQPRSGCTTAFHCVQRQHSL